MENCEEFLKANLSTYPDLAVLIIADEFPAAFLEHEGPIAYIGGSAPKSEVKSLELYYRSKEAPGGLLGGLKRLADFGAMPKFDIIYYDENHALKALLDQIRGTTPLAHDRTIHIFDDAVPPDISMTGPTGGGGWWVGEVWMLPEILQAGPIHHQWIIRLPPTGMLLATGIQAPDLAEVFERYGSLSRVATTEEILERLIPLEASADSPFLQDYLSHDMARGRKFIRLTSAGDSTGAEQSIELDAGKIWSRPPLELLLDLSAGSLNPEELRQERRYIHGKRLETYTDVYLTGLDSFIKDRIVYTRAIEHSEESARHHVDSKHYSRTVLQVRNGSLLLPDGALGDAVEVDGRTFFGTPDEPDNWGMWIVYGIPSAYHFVHDRGSYDHYFSYLWHPWQRKLLAYLGISGESLREHDLSASYHLRSMSLIRHDVRNLTVCNSDREIYLGLAARFKSESVAAPRERIYVSRRGLTGRGGYRQLINEAALIVALEDLGFAIIEPEKLEFPEQVACFANAKVIVALGGAGLFNAVFAAPGTRVVTIESSTGWVDSHVCLLASCGHRCGVILGQQDETDPEPFHKRWTIDVAGAIEGIKGFLRS